VQIWIWIGFITLIVGLLLLDLGVFHRKSHAIGTHEAVVWTLIWIGVGVAFSGVIYVLYEHDWWGIGHAHHVDGFTGMIEYLTAYVVEKSLSLDNIFVMALIFEQFAVPREYQHRVLFWGILGALVLRGIMILGGLTLLEHFGWLIYVFGGLLIVAAVRLLRDHSVEVDPKHGRVMRFIRKVFPVTEKIEGQELFVRQNGKLFATPLFLALVAIESADVLFAVDSIPAVFGVTRDAFIVFSSNVFAILGLRALYFAMAAVLSGFGYAKISLVFVLLFVGLKMILHHWIVLPSWASLAIIVGILGIGIIASVIANRRRAAE